MEDFDYLLEQAKLRRKQAMETQGQGFEMPQGRMVGGQYIPPSLSQALVQGLRQYGAYKDLEESNNQIKDITKQRADATNKAMAEFLRQSQGQSAITLPADQSGPTRPEIAPNLGAAYGALMQAPDENLRKFGMQGTISYAQAQEQERQKQAETLRKQHEEKRLLGVLQTAKTPQEAIQAGVPASMVKDYYESSNYGMVPVEFKDVGGEFVPRDKYGRTPENIEKISKTGDPYKDLVVRDSSGNIVPNAPLVGVKKDISKSGASRTNVQVINKGAEAFDVELAKLDAKQIDQWRDKAEQARLSLGTAQRLKDAEAKGAFSGAGADAKLAGARIISTLTGLSPKGIVGSELYNAEASKLVLEHIKGLGANPSNADREFIEKTVPRLATSADARKQMVDYIERASTQTINNYEEMQNYARKNRGLGGYQYQQNQPTNYFSAQDAQALEWAKANPKDPRAKAILQRLGVQ